MEFPLRLRNISFLFVAFECWLKLGQDNFSHIGLLHILSYPFFLLCIKGRRMKTKTPYRVQVLPPAWAIMEQYRGKRAGFVFDVPTTDVILNGMHHIQRNIGMETPLTFHCLSHNKIFY